MNRIILPAVFLSLWLTSCSEWDSTQEKDYLKGCEEGMKIGNSALDDAFIRKVCDCQLEKTKEKYSFAEWMELEDNDEDLKKILSDCYESALEE